ncbi:LysE family transporter [Salmonella enterica subsp. enterica]|nr:LysE family transporter [Salmonella enterica subsp. enterica]
MTTSINHGYRGAAAIADSRAGLGIHIVLVGVGLGTRSFAAVAFEILKWAGAAYIFYLAVSSNESATSYRSAYSRPDTRRGVGCSNGRDVNLTNPKSICLSCRPVSAIHHAAAAQLARHHSRRHYDCGGYDCSDDRLRHAGAAHCRTVKDQSR